MAIWSSEIKELEKLYFSLKGQLPDLEKELERLVKADDENMILLYSRRCLEVIITDLCECELKRPRKTEPLQGIIDKLHKEEKVPSHIIASMHGLNELSTYGAHPKDFDPRQVRTTLINLDTIIEWYLKYKRIDIKGEEEIQFKGESLEEVKEGAKIEEQEKPTKSPKQKLLSGVLITAILVIAAILIYPKIFKQDSLEKLRSKKEISIAVMPFQNMTNDTIWKVWQSGIQDILITSLSNSEVFKVNQTELTNYLIQSRGLTNYTSITPSIAREISQKLEADIFILGSIKEAGSTIRLNAQLIDSKTGEIFKSFEIDAPADENIILQISDSLRRMVTNFLIISELGEDWPFARSFSSITNSPEAFRYFTYGHKSSADGDYPTASDWYLKALTVDSTFTLAAGFLSWSYYNQGLYGQAKKVCMEVYKKRNVLPLKTKIVIDWFHAIYFETPYEEIKYMKQFIELDDHVQLAYYILGGCYNSLGQFENAIPEFEKCLEICEKWWSQPLSVRVYTKLGYAYHKTGQFKKEKKLYEEAERDFPDDYSLLSMQAVLALSEGKTKMADEYIGKYIAFRKEMSTSEATIASSLGAIYQDAGIMAKAEEYYRQALSLEPDNPNGYDYLAYFLFDNDRNIEEGLQLVDAALISDPENYEFLHTKGWGLYKQGKYKEALEILQRSWDLRRKNAIYDHEAYLHLEAAKRVVAG